MFRAPSPETLSLRCEENLASKTEKKKTENFSFCFRSVISPRAAAL